MHPTVTIKQPKISPRKAREFFETASSKLNLKTLDDWYSVEQKHLKGLSLPHTSYILSQYHSLQNALSSLYPEHDWKIWKFNRVPSQYWSEKANQRKCFEDLFAQWNFKSLDDWYSVKTNDVLNAGGSFLDTKYNGCISTALLTLFPEHNWLPWKFPRVPSKYWQRMEHQRLFFDWIAQQAEINPHSPLEWTKVSSTFVKKNGGAGLLSQCSKSLQKDSIHIQEHFALLAALSRVYPHVNWIPLKEFYEVNSIRTNIGQPQPHLPLEQLRETLDKVYSQLNLENMDDWYNVSARDVELHGGKEVLPAFKGSLIRSLQATYPEHNWQVWRFTSVSVGTFWANKENQRNFMEFVASKLHVQSPEDWYSVPYQQVYKLGGTTLLKAYYGNSLYKALSSIFPEHEWLPWKFQRTPDGFWKDSSNVVWYLDWLAKQLNITHLKDWMFVGADQIPPSLLRVYGGLDNLLQSVYSSYDWKQLQTHRKSHKMNSSLFQDVGVRFEGGSASGSKAQNYLAKLVHQLFPQEEMFTNYRHPEIMFLTTNRDMEFDIYLPSSKVAVEYFGQQHYGNHYLYGSPAYQQFRDEQKRLACKQVGITFIEVPFWWDRSIGSLTATIHEKRPDLKLVPDGSKLIPIPQEFPVDSSGFQRNSVLASEVKLRGIKPWSDNLSLTELWERSPQARPAKDSTNPVDIKIDFKNWFVMVVPKESVRVFWDSQNLFLVASTVDSQPFVHKKLPIPSYLHQLLPPMPLEGFMFYKDPSKSKDLSELFLNPQHNVNWEVITLSILDSPQNSRGRTQYASYKQRIFSIQASISQHQQKTNPSATTRVESASYQLLQDVGNLIEFSHSTPQHTVLVADPTAIYSQSFFFKVPTKDDEEEIATVLSHDKEHSTLLCHIQDQPVQVKLSADQNKLQFSKYVAIQKQDTTQDYSFMRFRQDVGVPKEQFRFQIRLGKAKGGQPRCRGCNKVISSRTEPRIEVSGFFRPTQLTSPHPAKFHVCLDAQCLKTLVNTPREKGQIGVIAPPFENRIGVPSELMEHVRREEPNWKDVWPSIEFVNCD